MTGDVEALKKKNRTLLLVFQSNIYWSVLVRAICKSKRGPRWRDKRSLGQMGRGREEDRLWRGILHNRKNQHFSLPPFLPPSSFFPSSLSSVSSSFRLSLSSLTGSHIMILLTKAAQMLGCLELTNQTIKPSSSGGGWGGCVVRRPWLCSQHRVQWRQGITWAVPSLSKHVMNKSQSVPRVERPEGNWVRVEREERPWGFYPILFKTSHYRKNGIHVSVSCELY